MQRLALALVLASLAAAAGARSTLPPFAGRDAVALGAVLDGHSLTLADGRTLRLAGIEAPAAPAALAARAKAALEKLVAGKWLELRYAGAPADREGRVVAALFAGGRWTERELVRRGLARVRGNADERIGLPELLAGENAACRARRGLWRERRYAVRAAENAARDAGTWQIVEGTVARVVRTDDGDFLEFGPDRASAFVAHVPRAALPSFRGAALDPLALDGARLRVRGFIDGSRRPTMEVTFPEQIERP